MVNHGPRALALALAAAAAVLAPGGCASVSFDDFKDVRASRWPEREERAGLVVSVRPVVAEEEVEFFFSANLLDHDILPVAVYLENRGQDTFTFKPAQMVMSCEDGTVFASVPWREVHEQVRFSYARALPGFIFAVIPGFMILHSVSIANERLSQDYHRKALEEFSLPPGDHIQGVVFMRPRDGVPLDVAAVEGADVQLAFVRGTGQSTAPFEMVFHLWGLL